MDNNQHILFIHIPKTAGTSFRVAAEEYYNKNNIFYDYSPQFKETSPSVIENIYEEQDHYKLYQDISKVDRSLLSGHFLANKYAPLYNMVNMVSFVRNPVEQVLSHYNHFKNIHAYDKGFQTFIKEQKFRNIQSKILRGRHIEMYGFLGLTEEYKLSIEMFNTLYKTKLKYKHINVKRKSSLSLEDLDEDTLKLIVRVNKVDMKLYKDIKEHFEIRKKLYDKHLPFTHGFIQKVTKNQISGMAYQKDNDEAIEIDIYHGENYMKTVLAKNLRPGQVRHNVPRRGFIGFDYIHSEDNLDEELRAFVQKTGQEIVSRV